MEDQRQEELDSLLAIFPELVPTPDDPFTVSLDLAINPAAPLLIRFIPTHQSHHTTFAEAANGSVAHVEHDVKVCYLPSLTVVMRLPEGYPTDAPPTVKLSTGFDWLPNEILTELEREAERLWEEYGRSQILYVYIDHLQQAAERGFDLEQSADGCLVLSTDAESAIVGFDAKTKQQTFDAGTYDCGVCLERRKGSDCYQMERCQHIFCRECLQAFYDNAIKEGDIAGIRCLDPGCGGDAPGVANQHRRRRTERSLHPRELLAMGIEDGVVRRFLDLQRKKKLEADKTTVYCPRTWCQGAAKSAKYPPIPADLTTYVSIDPLSDSEDDGQLEAAQAAPLPNNPNGRAAPPDPNDRLSVCEKCTFAFCRVCYAGWHGPYTRCYPRDPGELSAEEQASFDYIRLHTTPCAYCNAPVQKTMGCNHMRCFQCRTHFCYLCSAWLDPQTPYKHFNTAGTPCFQRLWELEEGDEGPGGDEEGGNGNGDGDGPGPGPGRVFVGGRGWEQLALEVARQADADEAAAAGEAQPDGVHAAVAEPAHLPPAPDPPAVAPEDDWEIPLWELIPHEPAFQRLRQEQERLQRQQNLFPPAPGAANAVRNHERARARRPEVVGVPPGRFHRDDRRRGQQAELQRFVELAQRDEEDGWDSDELGDDDERFVIR